MVLKRCVTTEREVEGEVEGEVEVTHYTWKEDNTEGKKAMGRGLGGGTDTVGVGMTVKKRRICGSYCRKYIKRILKVRWERVKGVEERKNN
jgi:hypothetical protein